MARESRVERESRCGARPPQVRRLVAVRLIVTSRCALQSVTARAQDPRRRIEPPLATQFPNPERKELLRQAAALHRHVCPRQLLGVCVERATVSRGAAAGERTRSLRNSTSTAVSVVLFSPAVLTEDPSVSSSEVLRSSAPSRGRLRSVSGCRSSPQGRVPSSRPRDRITGDVDAPRFDT